jgi:hypothetical protein
MSETILVNYGGNTQDHIQISRYRDDPRAAHLKAEGKFILGFHSRDMGGGMHRGIDWEQQRYPGHIKPDEPLFAPALVMPFVEGGGGKEQGTEKVLTIPPNNQVTISCWYKQPPISESWMKMSVDGQENWDISDVQPGDIIGVFWPVDRNR